MKDFFQFHFAIFQLFAMNSQMSCVFCLVFLHSYNMHFPCLLFANLKMLVT